MHTTPTDAAEPPRRCRTDVPGAEWRCRAAFAASPAPATRRRPELCSGSVPNVHHELSGAFTGEIGAPMLAGLAGWVIVGHSERRRDAGETDELIGRKLARAVEVGLRPILCVGEQLAEREAGEAEAVVAAQLRGSLTSFGGDPAALVRAGLIVAYEPVWAIGTGRTARGVDAAAMADAIRRSVAELGPGFRPLADELPVLYGGSVTAATIAEFLVEPSIDGALVGGASLKVEEMAGIVARAGVTAAGRRAAAEPGR